MNIIWKYVIGYSLLIASLTLVAFFSDSQFSNWFCLLAFWGGTFIMSAQNTLEKKAIIEYLDEKIMYWRSYEVYSVNPDMSEFYADAYETIRERISK